MNDLRAAFPLGLGLPGHGALHTLGKRDILHLDAFDVYAPRSLSGGIDDRSEFRVYLIAVREQGVQVGTPDHRSQRGLGNL